MKQWIRNILSLLGSDGKEGRKQGVAVQSVEQGAGAAKEDKAVQSVEQGAGVAKEGAAQSVEQGAGAQMETEEVGSNKMYIIVGLGNPGREYENTRHNIGFMTLDKLAAAGGIDVLEKKHKALIGKGVIDGQKVILAKPLTYMNLSGESVRELIDYYKLDETAELVVISDDVSLPPGQLRVRKKGSAGGHNGLKNIILHLGHDQFIRLRMGVGEKPAAYDMKDYVLGHFTGDEKKLMDEAAKRGADCIRKIMADGPDAAMNEFNGAVK